MENPLTTISEVDELQVDDLEVKPNEEIELTPDPELDPEPEPDPDPELDPESTVDEPPDLSAPAPPEAPPQALAVDREKIREEYQALDITFNDLRASKEAIGVKMAETEKAMMRLRPHLGDIRDPHANQKAIIHYIKSQKELRQTKMKRRNEVLQGLQLHDVLPMKGSKLDESMMRKRGFGTQRPHYPSTQP
ncbi:MAG: hypothetical protein V3W44_10110 [Dehalococcoidales bacterium]